jgi:drug/metabolite transporter (DMT)-like permease
MAWTPTFIFAGLWLGLGISVGATFALYRLIARGNLVNVTSTMYLVPGVTALLDWIVLGHPMAPLGLAGLGAIIAGLVLTFG